MPSLTPPPLVAALAADVHAAGGQTLLVGGSVRDHIMGLPVKDWDLEVHRLKPQVLETLLAKHGKVNTVGRSFAVYKLHRHGIEFDISLPRRDSKQGKGHKGIAIEADPFMGIEEAARRRDLTINAIMLDVVTGDILDPFDGQRDISAKRLSAVDEKTFLEDPLRALRVVQFAARLGFEPQQALLRLCREASLDELPPERIQGEWIKLFLRGTHHELGFRIARETNTLSRVFPEAAGLDSHSLTSRLDLAFHSTLFTDDPGRRIALRIGAWLLPFHDQPGLVTTTFDRMRLFRVEGYRVRDQLLAAFEALAHPNVTAADLRRASTHAELALLLPLQAVHSGSAPDDTTLAPARALDILTQAPEPICKGRHLNQLGVTPGRIMGELLEQVYAAQLEGDVTTLEEAKGLAQELWVASRT